MTGSIHEPNQPAGCEAMADHMASFNEDVDVRRTAGKCTSLRTRKPLRSQVNQGIESGIRVMSSCITER
jgi:hypothetical protein